MIASSASFSPLFEDSAMMFFSLSKMLVSLQAVVYHEVAGLSEIIDELEQVLFLDH